MPVHRSRAFGIASLVAVLGGCSLLVDLEGLAGSAAPDGGDDALSEAGEPRDGGPDVTFDDAPFRCDASTTIDEPFATDLGGWVPLQQAAPGYPKLGAFAGDPAAILLPIVDVPKVDAGSDAAAPPADEYDDARSGLWFPTVVPLQAFDVDFEMQVRCPVPGSCADGLAFAWLDLATLGPLTNVNTGHAAGLPEGVAGAAFYADNYRNDETETSDPPAPALEIIGIDPTKPVGTYPWVVASRAASFMEAWHAIGIRVRGGDVEVLYDGAPFLSGKVAPVAKGIIGLTAGTGGETDAVAVRKLKGRFFSCSP
jgi:hypothetical protein